MAAVMLLGLSINTTRKRANQPEIKHSQLNDSCGRAPSVMSRLRISVHPASRLHPIDICENSGPNKKDNVLLT